jgi:hypothetical protein
VNGHYHYACDEWCADCLPVPADSPEVQWDGPHDGSQDTPANCCKCGVLLPCTLTPDGVNYVIEYLADAVERGTATDCERGWAAMLHEYFLHHGEQFILDSFLSKFGELTT